MAKWIKENKIAAGIIVILIGILGFVYFDKNPSKIGDIGKTSQLAQESTSFGDKVLSFNSLDKVEKFEDLTKWGLVAPEQYNHTAGKNLIMLAIKANAIQKGDWVTAHGLLGTSMLDVDLLDREGYKSLFSSMFTIQGFKMYASSLNTDMGLLVDIDGTVKPTKSIIAQREGIIYAASNELEGRYVYNDAGNFGKNYLPEPTRKSNAKLSKILLNGLKVYNQLRTAGFDDKTLRDALCITYASLDYDNVSVDSTDIYYLGSLQVCKDALKATLTKLNSEKDNNYNFLQELGWEMQSRSLASGDGILIPDDEKNFEAMLKVIEKDLDSIKK
ncbi:MAG: hypothetical protein HYW45_03300 [Candidatus Daviesbacteria bacterium]|nr:MAG: hypothetical protein HYW45_03300 [Candidatus Daviesbacteria bacterium]